VTKALNNKMAMGCIVFSGVAGSSIGIALSMKAFQETSMSNATTILSLVPVFLIPFAVFLHKEHVSPRALIGTLMAFAGIYLMVSV
jgi:drug/metabolite transporter (DMT)-like permease